MPTENRSSNTELSKIATEALVGMVFGVTGMKPPTGEPLPGFIQAPIDRAVTRISDLLAQPARQPHPEPIAWMVGTAIWWTKEEAERDAAATGLPIVGLGPMTAIGRAEQHQGEPVGLPGRKRDSNEDSDVLTDCHNGGWNACLDEIAKLGPLYTRADPGEVERLREALTENKKAYSELESQVAEDFKHIDDLRAKLAERDALLREKSGDLIRMAAHLISAPLFALQELQDEDKKMTRTRVDKAVDTADARLKDAAYELRRIADALSASAGPSSPTWSCQACQVEQPTDRACDACGGQTALIAAKS